MKIKTKKNRTNAATLSSNKSVSFFGVYRSILLLQIDKQKNPQSNITFIFHEKPIDYFLFRKIADIPS